MKEVLELLENDLEAMKDAMWCMSCDEVPGSLVEAVEKTEAFLERIRGISR